MSETVGEQLRAARETRGWSVDEVAARLRIPARYVTALETGDAAALPEPTFVRGYVKSYAKALGLDADSLLALMMPVEVKAPRPLIGPEGQAGSTRRTNAGARAPSFRTGSSKRYQVVGGIVLLGVVAWMLWPKPEPATAPAVTLAPPAPVAPAAPVVNASEPAAAGGVTLEVPLPGAAIPPATLPAPASAANVAAMPAVTGVAVPAGQLPAKPALPPSPAKLPVNTTATQPAAEAAPAAVAPRKGLHARFSGTCWVEVRDADNVVIHTRIAMAGNEISVDGKAPLTVTLGDASAAEIWYNGDRVAADRFSSNGIARIIVGQAPR